MEDKVLHLVKRPPPSSSKATPTTTTTEDQPTPPLGEVNTTQDLLFVGTGMPSQSELAQVTQVGSIPPVPPPMSLFFSV